MLAILLGFLIYLTISNMFSITAIAHTVDANSYDYYDYEGEEYYD